MPRLPGPEQLGGLPSLRSGRTAPSVGSLDTGASAIAKGAAAVGAGLTAVAERQSQEEDYDSLKRIVQFERETEQDLERYKREIVPGGQDFQRGWDERYSARAKEFFGDGGGNFPARMRQKLDLRLVQNGEKYSTHALKYEFAERDRFHLADLNDQIAQFAREVEVSPHLLKEKQDYARAMIDKAPIEARLKPQAHKNALSILEKTARQALVMGAATAEDFRKAEETLFVSAPVKPERPQKGDPGQLFKGPSRSFSPAVESAITEAANRTGVDKGLLRTFAQIESSGNAGAKTGSYKGLFQLSDEEFKRVGGQGDIFDPQANAIAAATKLKEEMAEFKAKRGRDPSAAELYMIHQQGVGGSAAHWDNPDKPAWQNMASTAEGRQKGERWAKQAIWGNVPDDVKRKYGSVENVTSRDFVDLWDKKVASFGGARAGVGGPKDGPVPADVAAAPRLGPPAMSEEGIEQISPRKLGGPSTDPNVRWASEERGESTYTGPFQNSSLDERKATWKQLDARRKQFVGALEAEIKTYEAQAAEGILPPEPYLADLAEKVERIGDPQVKAYFESVMGHAALTTRLSKGRPEELEAILRKERAQNTDADGTLRLTPVADKRMKHVEKLVANMRTQINADPITWAGKTGVAKGLGVEIADIDPADPVSMQKRAEAARVIGNYYGQEPQFFTKGEKDKFTDVMRKGGEPMLQTLASITQNFGADAPLAVASFAKDMPEGAYLGGMMLDSQLNKGANVGAIKDAAHTIEMRRDKNYKSPLAEDAAYKTKVSETVGTAFRELSGNRAAAVAVTNAAYEARALKMGKATFDPDLWEKTWKEVIGESTHENQVYGGMLYQNSFNWFNSGKNNPILVPPNIRKDGFRDLINSIRPEDIFQTAGHGGVESSPVGPMGQSGGEPVPLPMAALRRANLVTVGPGQYRLSLGDPDGADPQWVKDVNGDDYVLDMRALEPALKRRRPDLYLGAPRPVPRPPVPSEQIVTTP
jgi:hypothetical protein